MTEADFIAAINADPQSRDDRLIYADWLEEKGDAFRSEFVRTEIEYAALDFWDGSAPHYFDQLVNLLPKLDIGWIESVGYRYDFRLLDFGNQKLNAVKDFKFLSGWTLMKSLREINTTPTTLIYRIPFHGVAKLRTSAWFPRDSYQFPKYKFFLSSPEDPGRPHAQWKSDKDRPEDIDSFGRKRADLYLTAPGDDREKVIAVVKELEYVPKFRAKRIVNNCPSRLREHLSRTERREVTHKLEGLLKQFKCNALFEFHSSDANVRRPVSTAVQI